MHQTSNVKVSNVKV